MNEGMNQAIVDLVAPVVEADGADLEQVTVARAGRRSVVKITVDADGGLTLDRVADLSRAVSSVLDGADVMGEAPWTLEVGSRGATAPLTLPRHWRRNVGRLVKVKVLRESGDGADQTVGRLVEAGDAEAVLRDEDTGITTSIAYDDVHKASVQLEFTRGDTRRPGSDGDAAEAFDEPVDPEED